MKQWGCTVISAYFKYCIPFDRIVERNCSFGRAMTFIEQGYQARRASVHEVHVLPKCPRWPKWPFENNQEGQKGFFTVDGAKWRPSAQDMLASDWEILTND